MSGLCSSLVAGGFARLRVALLFAVRCLFAASAADCRATCALFRALCEFVLLFCFESVLLFCSNSPSWLAEPVEMPCLCCNTRVPCLSCNTRVPPPEATVASARRHHPWPPLQRGEPSKMRATLSSARPRDAIAGHTGSWPALSCTQPIPRRKQAARQATAPPLLGGALTRASPRRVIALTGAGRSAPTGGSWRPPPWRLGRCY